MDSILITDSEKLNKQELYSNTNDTIVSMEMLTKIGEVFLSQRQMQEMFVYFCSMCEDKFFTLDAFTEHITEVHILVDSPEVHNDEEIEEISAISDGICELNYVDENVETLDEEFLQNGPGTNELNLEVSQQPTNQLTNYKSQPASGQYANKNQFSLRHRKNSQDLEPNKRFQCAKCTKCFKRKWNLKTHELSHKSIKPHACSVCSSTFVNKQNLVIHMRRHLGEKPFQCSLCPKTFVSSTEKNLHHRSHTGERPYICEKCGRGHATSSQLHEHHRRHSNERRYPCEVCNKRFRTSTNLRSHHMTVHANLPRSYCCMQCAAGFKTTQALYQHAKIHSSQKHYKCRVCDKEFAQHPGLYAHMKTHAK